jgi:hypothetical protein
LVEYLPRDFAWVGASQDILEPLGKLPTLFRVNDYLSNCARLTPQLTFDDLVCGEQINFICEFALRLWLLYNTE